MTTEDSAKVTTYRISSMTLDIFSYWLNVKVQNGDLAPYISIEDDHGLRRHGAFSRFFYLSGQNLEDRAYVYCAQHRTDNLYIFVDEPLETTVLADWVGSFSAKKENTSKSKVLDFKRRYHLSDRELEVFLLWGDGRRVKEIAQTLILQTQTIKNMKATIAEKLECKVQDLRKVYLEKLKAE